MGTQAKKNGLALPYKTFVLPCERYMTTKSSSLIPGWRPFKCLFRGQVHLISGHPSINGEADKLFDEYQDQATEGKIQFRRWPLRSVSLLLSFFPVPMSSL